MHIHKICINIFNLSKSKYDKTFAIMSKYFNIKKIIVYMTHIA